MKPIVIPEERGQTLVLVAITLLVLVLVTGLAVDGGECYAARRRMQNAADAAALAGARAMCFDGAGPLSIRDIASSYARQNGADADAEAVVVKILDGDGNETEDGNIIYVRAGHTVETRFARAAGIGQITVSAEAAAACGESGGGCGIFPLAFEKDAWENIPGGGYFYIWDDDSAPQWTDNICDCCECEGEVFGGPHIGPGHRGWLRLRWVPEPFPSSPCEGNCGASALGCWIANDYPGQISAGDCIPGNPGVKASVLDDAAARIGDTVDVVLYDMDGVCTEEDKIQGCNASEWYKVTGIGCAQIELVYTKVTLDKIEPEPEGCEDLKKCPKNAKAIYAYKPFTCDATACGSTTGAPTGPGEVGAVSLVPVPGD